MSITTFEPAHARDFATLGAILLEAGESVTTVGASLQEVRTALELRTLEYSVFPTLVLVTESHTGATVSVTARTELTFREAAVANQLPSQLRRGQVRLDQVPELAHSMRSRSKPRSFWRTVLGNAVTAASFATLFQSPWWAILTALVVGVIVGMIMGVFERSRPGVALQPFVVSFISTVLIGLASTWFSFPNISLFAVVAPVVVLVPGSVIAKALLEVTSADVISGAARMVGGLMMMGFMLAGIAAGSVLTGLAVDPTTSSLVGEITRPTQHGGWESTPPLWAVWLGVIGLAAGVSIIFQAGTKLSLASALIMCAAYAAALLFTPVLGAAVAIGAAAGVVFLAAKTLERLHPALPAAVTFFPAFLLFVPGTVALVSLATQSQGAVMAALTSFLSLCIGIHVGGLVDLWLDKTVWRLHRERTTAADLPLTGARTLRRPWHRPRP